MGSCQEKADLSGMTRLLDSLAVRVSIMRVTEGCLCVGECFSAFCVYRSVSSNCTVISPGGQFFRGDKGRLLGLQPQWQGERYPKASEHHENTLLYIHKHTPLTQHRPVWLWSTQVLWVLSHCAACLS